MCQKANLNRFVQIYFLDISIQILKLIYKITKFSTFSFLLLEKGYYSESNDNPVIVYEERRLGANPKKAVINYQNYLDNIWLYPKKATTKI